MEIKEIVDYVIKTPDNSNPAVLKDILLKYTDEISKKSGPDPSKLIKFVDYDGTLIYSYTPEEFIKLKELPANPSHSGLIAQGWNWTLAQIKEQLTAMPDAPVWVGQMYITDDGKTRLYCHFGEGRLAPYLGIGVKGTVVVDWGDGSSTDTLTGTSLTKAKTVQHTYASAGDYVITLTVSSGSFSFFGEGNAAWVLTKDGTNASNISRVYANAIQKVELGANAFIGNYAFQYCCSLTNITIPDGVTSISTYAFQDCYGLTSITIPNGVTSIGDYAFIRCRNLVRVMMPDSITSISSDAFQDCYNLANITLPNGIMSIGNEAFDCCTCLTSITIPDGVTSIGNKVFRTCHGLTSITITDGVKQIGTDAFSGCYGLVSITLPDGVTSIGSNAFQYCSSLTSITIPDGVKQISSHTFEYCSSLVSIMLSDGITSIGTYAFRDCYNLVNITIPDRVASIGSSAFSGCYGLAEIHFKPVTPPTVSGSGAWTGIPTDCKIYVPAGTLSAYTSATNYPSSSTYTYVEE